MECSGVLKTTQFAYWKGLGTCDAHLCMSCTLQSALERECRRRGSCRFISWAAFDRVNHHGILYKLCSVGIGGSLLSVLTQFLSNQWQHIMVDGCRSKHFNVVSGVPQGSVSGMLLRLCTLRSSFPFWKISWSVMLMTPLWWLVCHPQALELQ